MTEPLPGFELPPEPPKVVARPAGRLVKVQPDITSVRQAFTYLVPPAWEDDGRAEKVAVGSLVRVDFGGRRTAGWITEVDVDFDETVEVRPLSKWSSYGPPQDVLDLAAWAADRWAGRLPHFLRAASPPRMVSLVRHAPPIPDVETVGHEAAFDGAVTLVRTAPADDGLGLALGAASQGRALILCSTIAHRRALARGLRDAGVGVAEYDDQWERSASGATTVGTRTAAFAPMPHIDAVLVLDEHDSTYKEERTPSWNARDVAIERARRAGVPCVLASPSPSLEAHRAADRILTPERVVEKRSWPRVDVVDMRDQDTPGLLSEAIVDTIRGDGPIACILNRKGRARMLACATCSSLAACTECGGALREDDDGRLVCDRDATVRPMVCNECNATHMKQLRLGISRLAEDLGALAKRSVVEVSAETPQRDLSGNQLFIGTEALLHRIESAKAVVFLDFDQELAVPRYRAAEDAFGLLALSARRVGPRADGGRIIIQTRRPDDVVVQAALNGDPGRVASTQRDVRQVFQQPPYGAWALISGAGAEEFVDGLERARGSSTAETVRINRLGDRWRVAAPTHEPLLAAINAVERPVERIRIEIDPLSL